MGKYDPLRAYLRRKRGEPVELSFDDLERILHALLPKGAQHHDWWSNDVADDAKTVQHHAWLDAGYEATLLPGERVSFRRRSPPA
ncbi:MAG: hypothetical protein Q8Q88_00640 [Phenylobacterium sp.]|uniref:DUF7662 domain-containing protein n=1 Tax=Phenylobacterium sp. TaxID=1871053 RepID=UPI00273621D4|nr:hypothetical protein [Phenylobacterium sp.]MDP3745531.1 hypothetical protein [Phenylobacterium sp.]